MAETVFISGATGFIAQHIVKLLISKGYHVVGSVRSTAKGEKLKQNVNSENFSYEIVEDLESVGAFDAALKKHPEVTIFLHTASPVTFAENDVEKEILLPAINGTKNVLKAIKAQAPQITKLVITASIVSVDSVGLKSVDETSFNSITWEESKTSGFAAYAGSKTFAEKAAWEFIETEKPNFTLSTIHPVYVFGPQAYGVDGELNFSNTVVSKLLQLKPGAEVPVTIGSFIDVRDVAESHLVAFEKEGAAGQRFILTNSRFSNQTLLDIINANIPELKGKITEGIPGSQTPTPTTINDKKTREFLDFKYIDLKKSVVDTIEQYISSQK